MRRDKFFVPTDIGTVFTCIATNAYTNAQP